MEIAPLIAETAQSLGMSPVDLATIISYETGGTFDPVQAGPTTQWGRHRGLIQFGEPQAREYGADLSSREAAIASQLGPEGAIVRYFRKNGWRPGMSLLDAYSIVNAGGPGRYNASDANNGGAPGTVADKVQGQFGPHRANAERLLGGYRQEPVYRGELGGQNALDMRRRMPPVDEEPRNFLSMVDTRQDPSAFMVQRPINALARIG